MTREESDYIIASNVRRFRLLLEIETDQEKRATLNRLLRDERAKLQDHRPPQQDPGSTG